MRIAGRRRPLGADRRSRGGCERGDQEEADPDGNGADGSKDIRPAGRGSGGAHRTGRTRRQAHSTGPSRSQMRERPRVVAGGARGRAGGSRAAWGPGLGRGADCILPRAGPRARAHRQGEAPPGQLGAARRPRPDGDRRRVGALNGGTARRRDAQLRGTAPRGACTRPSPRSSAENPSSGHSATCEIGPPAKPSVDWPRRSSDPAVTGRRSPGLCTSRRARSGKTGAARSASAPPGPPRRCSSRSPCFWSPRSC